MIADVEYAIRYLALLKKPSQIPIIGTFVKTKIMSKNTSIVLGEHFEVFISKKVESGRYHSASEVIREGLRLLEYEEKKNEELRSALDHGEESGIAHDFNVTSHLKSLHSKHKQA